MKKVLNIKRQQEILFRMKTRRDLAQLPQEIKTNELLTSGVGLVRVSSHAQIKNNSEAIQISSIKDYAKKNNINLVAIFSLTESAKASAQRVLFGEILRWCNHHKIQERIFYKQDREARNVTDIEEMLGNVKTGAFRVHYSFDSKILDKNTKPNDIFARKLMGSFDSYYSDELSHKVAVACLAKAKSGWFPGSQPPWGYRNEKTVSKAGFEQARGTTIVVDKNSAKLKIVKKEFELRASGLSWELVRDRIIKLGLVPLHMLPLYRSTSIARRLANPFYGGFFRWRGELFKGNHELFIKPSVYALACSFNEVAGKRKHRNHTVVVGDEVKENGIFSSGWIKCSCGAGITFERKVKRYGAGRTKEYFFYRCSNGFRQHSSLKGLYISEQSMWDQLGAAVKNISISPEIAQDLSRALNTDQRSSARSSEHRLRTCDLQLQAIQADELRAYQDYTHGLVSERMLRTMLSKFQIETAKLETEKVRLIGSDKAALENAQSIIELAKSAESLWMHQSAEVRRDFLEMILSNRNVEGATVRYTLKKPFLILAEMSKNKDWRRERDSNSR